MKIRKWIAAVLAISLILPQFAFGEGTGDRAEIPREHPDISEETVLPETKEDENTGGIPFSTELNDNSMIFIFDTTEPKVVSPNEDETELADDEPKAPEADGEAEDEVQRIPETEAEGEILEQGPETDMSEKNSAAQAESEMYVTNDALSVPEEAGLVRSRKQSESRIRSLKTCLMTC